MWNRLCMLPGLASAQSRSPYGHDSHEHVPTCGNLPDSRYPVKSLLILFMETNQSVDSNTETSSVSIFEVQWELVSYFLVRIRICYMFCIRKCRWQLDLLVSVQEIECSLLVMATSTNFGRTGFKFNTESSRRHWDVHSFGITTVAPERKPQDEPWRSVGDCLVFAKNDLS